ncbi:PQQ-dependent dehydrogenase (methanol/ethanol family) [Litorivivens lipolytica]|uniref:PQQ-dependent dehydrogenase (Methanol/ethanol family) n=1 Tax=Litorivivens lipolytica TaxID=1524264 RepID=A0A7W4W6A7_9GAMM|nr:PQQ-dependent dehydrogenase, methanol/ethanol family [Litorivivens lipolytica]MBB3047863.1 PQQ-dependent dehydrogenase (methanol/ethanol family) [Litorivivens lipolytica]
MHKWFSVVALVLLTSACSKDAPRPVELPDVTKAEQYPGQWITHGRTYSEQRFSPLKQITRENVDSLGLAWSFDLGTSRGIETTPLVVDGVMYATATWNIVYALDARTGQPLWRFDPKVDRSKAADLCCDVVNRGVAYWQGKIFTGTIDGRLIALDAKSGEKLWDVVTVDQSKPYTITGAPRVVKGKVLIGNGGAEFGVRGYISAFDADTGKQVWRFYTVPGNPHEGHESEIMAEAAKTWTGRWWQYGGGGTVWDSMAYDPELDLLYFGVGNGSPWNQAIRSPEGGDNLFLSSIVAVKPDSGEYVWHYQTTPGETWDYTATQHLVLAELKIDGAERKVIMQAPKNGFFYVIDRETGELISANNYVPVNWATHIDLNTGRPVEVPEARWGNRAPHLQLPGPLGAHNWHPTAFSPDTGLVYIPVLETPYIYGDEEDFQQSDVRWNVGANAGLGSLPNDKAQYLALRAAVKGRLLAWNPVTQSPAWKVEHDSPWNGGVLATAGGLVFQGNADAKLVAYDAKSGERLWEHFAQTGIVAPPISYELDGEQYIAVASGWGGAFALIYGGLFPAESAPGVGRLLVFKLGADGTLPELVGQSAAKPSIPPLEASADVIAKGQQLYNASCLVCHGDHAVSSGLLPDLRWSPLLGLGEAWNAVVLGGARAAQGMPVFASDLDEADSEAIRQYVISEARAPFEEKFKDD